MAVQRGRSKRGGEAYSFPYVEPLSAARTKLADIFNLPDYRRRLGNNAPNCNAKPMSPLMRSRPDMATAGPFNCPFKTRTQSSPERDRVTCGSGCEPRVTRQAPSLICK